MQVRLLSRGRRHGLLQWQCSFFPLCLSQSDVCHGVPHLPPQVHSWPMYLKVCHWLPNFRPHGIDTALVEVPKVNSEKSQVKKKHLITETAASPHIGDWNAMKENPKQDTIHSVTNLEEQDHHTAAYEETLEHSWSRQGRPRLHNL